MLHELFHDHTMACSSAFAVGLLGHLVWDIVLVAVGGFVGFSWTRRCRH
jgi:hypothetical protein